MLPSVGLAVQPASLVSFETSSSMSRLRGVYPGMLARRMGRGAVTGHRPCVGTCSAGSCTAVAAPVHSGRGICRMRTPQVIGRRGGVTLPAKMSMTGGALGRRPGSALAREIVGANRVAVCVADGKCLRPDA